MNRGFPIANNYVLYRFLMKDEYDLYILIMREERGKMKVQYLSQLDLRMSSLWWIGHIHPELKLSQSAMYE